MEIRKVNNISFSESKNAAVSFNNEKTAMFGCNFDADDGLKVEKGSSAENDAYNRTEIDENGNKVIFNYSKGKIKTEYHYLKGKQQPYLVKEYSDGKRIETTYEDGKLKVRNVYGADNQPLELMKKTVKNDGQPVFVNYLFREDGTRLGEDTYLPENTKKPVSVVRFSQNGKNIVKITTKEDDGRYCVADFTPKGVLSRIVYFTDDRLSFVSEKITYDKKGNETEHVVYNNSKKISDYKNILSER